MAFPFLTPSIVTHSLCIHAYASSIHPCLLSILLSICIIQPFIHSSFHSSKLIQLDLHVHPYLVTHPFIIHPIIFVSLIHSCFFPVNQYLFIHPHSSSLYLQPFYSYLPFVYPSTFIIPLSINPPFIHLSIHPSIIHAFVIPGFSSDASPSLLRDFLLAGCASFLPQSPLWEAEGGGGAARQGRGGRRKADGREHRRIGERGRRRKRGRL